MGSSAKRVIILGGQGNGTVIAAAIEDANRRGYREWVVAGYLNDRLSAGMDLEGHPVLGPLSEVSRFLQEDNYFIYTIYRLDGQDRRLKLYKNLHLPDERLATFIHPSAYVAPNVQIGPGCVIMPNVAISSGARLGRCCLVMVGATIGHNDQIGDHCHLAAQSCLGAFVQLGDGVHIGLNATIRENIKIGDGSALGMGAVLLETIGPGEVWAGVPAKYLRPAQREI